MLTLSTKSTACSPRRPPSARRLLQAVVAGALALQLVAAVVSAAEAPAAAARSASKSKGKGKKGKKPKGTAATLSQMLTDKSSVIQDCAGKHALDKGASRVDISTKVTINNRGQVISLVTHVTLDKDKGDGAEKVKECVDAQIRSIGFPPSEAPLITIDRNWTISSG